MDNFRIIVILFYVFFLNAQEDNPLRIIKADYLESKTINGVVVQQLHGNVILRRGDIILYTDDANYYKDKKEFHLSGQVMMVEKKIP